MTMQSRSGVLGTLLLAALPVNVGCCDAQTAAMDETTREGIARQIRVDSSAAARTGC